MLFTVAVASAGAVLPAGQANASSRYDELGRFSGPGSGLGELVTPQRVAVETATRNIFVVDSGNDRIQVFRPAGRAAQYLTEFGTGTLDAPYGIAIDQESGDVYVSDFGNRRIVRFTSDGAAVPSFTLDPGFASPTEGAGPGEVRSFLADVELAPNGDVLVADPGNNRIQRYDDTGAFLSEFDGSTNPDGRFTGLIDMAVDDEGEIVVVDAQGTVADIVNGMPSRVLRFEADGDFVARVGPSVPSPGAVTIDRRTGDVIVAGKFYESYAFSEWLQIYVFDASGSARTTFTLPPDTVWSIVSGMAQDAGNDRRLYVVTAYDPLDDGGEYGLVGVQTYEPPPRPTATTLKATTTESTARMWGRVNPNGLETRYWFEYGTSTDYGNSLPAGQDADAGRGTTLLELSRQLVNVPAGVTYHYRIVAENESGIAYGGDRTFVVGGYKPPRATPGLPDGRAYEVVSPGAGKGSGELGAFFVQTTGDGNRAVYRALNVFGDASQAMSGVGDALSYVATRTAGGWRSTFVTAIPQPNPALNRSSFYTVYAGSTPDLSTTFTDVRYYGAPGFTSGVWAGDASGGASVVAASPDNNTLPMVLATSFGGERRVISSELPLGPVPGGPARNTLWDDAGGNMRLINVDNAGNLLHPTGGFLASGGGGGIESALGGPKTLKNPMSADGSRIFFYSREPGAADTAPFQLYARVDGQRTVQLSASQHSQPQPPLERAYFAGASSDGTRVFFATAGRLTDAATGAGPFLYQYDLPKGATTGTLKLIAGNDHPVVTDSSAVSNAAQAIVADSGGYVYYYSSAGEGTVFGYNTATQVTRAIAERTGYVQLATSLYSPGVATVAEITPDGRYLLFPARATGIAGPDDTNLGTKLYRYDAATGDFQLVSTTPDAPAGSFDSHLLYGNVVPRFLQADSNMISDDGRYVFFQTEASLLPEDTNDSMDVYRWRDGNVALVSDGTKASRTLLGGASADGSSVFFLTLSSLVPQDGDRALDLYVARIGGGFPVPPRTEPCIGDACQGAPSGPLATPTPQTDAFSGPGNQEDPDVTPPTARLRLTRVSARQRARLARTGRITVTASARAAGTITGRLRVRRGRRWVLVSTKRARLARAGSARVTLTLRRAWRNRLASRGALRIRIEVAHSGSPTVKQTGFVIRAARTARRAPRAGNRGGRR